MSNEHKFDELCSKVRFCTRCERMDESARILSRAGGSLGAEIMFIGEAPGRLGADASEIPFHGDKSGHNFEELLSFAGLDRSMIFVTNAVLCNPKTSDGNNATPNRVEVQNCSQYLKEQIDLVQPKVVVSLGSVALDALRLVGPHHLELSRNVRSALGWYGRILIPCYHPGARAMMHRSMANQRSDYQFVAEQARRLRRTRKAVTGQTPTDVADVVRWILLLRGETSYFALHKLLYLIECEATARFGHQLTKAFFLRQKDGPYCTDLHLAKLRRALPQIDVSENSARLAIRQPQFGIFDSPAATSPSVEVAALLSDVLRATSTLSDAELKTKVYLTAPMRRLVRTERTQLTNLYNSPIRFDEPRRTAEIVEA